MVESGGADWARQVKMAESQVRRIGARHPGYRRVYTATGRTIGFVLLQDIGSDADGDALGGFPHRVAREMRIARSRLHPSVTEQPADDRQALAERERPARRRSGADRGCAPGGGRRALAPPPGTKVVGEPPHTPGGRGFRCRD